MYIHVCGQNSKLASIDDVIMSMNFIKKKGYMRRVLNLKKILKFLLFLLYRVQSPES